MNADNRIGRKWPLSASEGARFDCQRNPDMLDSGLKAEKTESERIAAVLTDPDLITDGSSRFLETASSKKVRAVRAFLADPSTPTRNPEELDRAIKERFGR